MGKSKLKVSDLVQFDEADYKLAKTTIIELNTLASNYSSMVDIVNPESLDKIKREFVAHMSTLTTIYSKVKAFKGTNHTYLEDARKEFKAKAFSLLRAEGVNTTEANTTVYDSEYYKDRVNLMEKLKQFFIEVDEMHAFFNNVLQMMQQTISIVSKDYEHSRYKL